MNELIVHLRVNDAQTQQPTPVRVCITDSQGKAYFPLSRSAIFPIGRNECVGGQVSLNGQLWFYCDGTCEIRLPTQTPLRVKITKGIFYRPIEKEIILGAGQMALRFAMEMGIDSAPYHSVDSRCHFLSPTDAAFEGNAEGLDTVQLLVREYNFPANDGHLYKQTANLLAFSGQTPAWEKGSTAVYVNTFNQHPALGRLGLLHCHRAVYPLSFGGEESDDWSLADWCEQCHRKKGLVTWCDAYRPEAGLAGGEALINAILGKVDALEWDSVERKRPFLPLYYRLLNAGIRLPLIGGSGKDSNRIALGSTRTIVKKSDLSPIEAIRQGLALVTNGPIPYLHTESDAVQFGFQSLVPIQKIELIGNGQVLTSRSYPEGAYRDDLTSEQKDFVGWLAVRCLSGQTSPIYPTETIFAHTSPDWNRAQAGQGQPQAITGLLQEMVSVRDWIEQQGHFTNANRKARLLELCQQAEEILRHRLG